MACEMKCPQCDGEFLHEFGNKVCFQHCMMCGGHGVVMAEFRRLTFEELETSKGAREMAGRRHLFQQVVFVDGDPIMGVRKF